MNAAIGKSIFEIYPTLKPETSTLIAAIQRGETTLNNRETLTTLYWRKLSDYR